MKKYIYILVIFTMVFSSCETEEPIPTYTLFTTVSPPEGGKLNVSPSLPIYPEGITVTITPEPNEHWVFKQWEGDGSGTSTPLQLTMDSNKSVVGVFVKRDYPLNITITGEGTVEEKIVTNPGGREYPHGTTVELTPKPKEGWVFESWGGDLTGTESPKTIKVDKEKNVTVKFKEIPKFYLHENGVTCLCPDTKPGDKGFINGVEFESVDNDLLRKRRDEGVDMGKLCTSLVTDMSNLFVRSPLNQPIGNWDVSKVTTMKAMFTSSQFNQPIGNWDVSKVVDMTGMFQSSPFNQPIGNWNVSNVTNMFAMFNISQFNQPIGNWNVSKVMYMNGMFSQTPFNQPIGNWDVSKVTQMNGMFSINYSFNQPIGNWNVSKVISMRTMFSSSVFNQPIGNWNVSNVTHMVGMFTSSQFNQPIGNWDVSNVTDMTQMFSLSPFNQNLSKWCVTKITSEPNVFSTNSPLTSQNKPKWGTCPD